MTQETRTSIRFIAWNYGISLFCDSYVSKAKLYVLKKKIENGTSGLDIEHFVAFTLKEDWTVESFYKRNSSHSDMAIEKQK
jgi:hypothetical protein